MDAFFRHGKSRQDRAETAEDREERFFHRSPFSRAKQSTNERGNGEKNKKKKKQTKEKRRKIRLARLLDAPLRTITRSPLAFVSPLPSPLVRSRNRLGFSRELEPLETDRLLPSCDRLHNSVDNWLLVCPSS